MKPPLLADWVLRALVRPGAAEDVIGDLHEEFSCFKVRELGPAGARCWYWHQVWGVLVCVSQLRLPGRGPMKPLVRIPYQPKPVWWTGLATDFIRSLRRLRASPGFSATAIATLAIGIGSIAAVFSAVNGVLLEPLPYDQPKELVVIGGLIPEVAPDRFIASGPEYRDYLEGAESVSGLAAAISTDANLTGGEAPVRVAVAAITVNLFPLLGVDPLMGRGFREEDTDGHIGYVAILSHRAWQRHFSGNPNVLGRETVIDGDAFSIVGIMPKEFKHPGEPDTNPVEIWAPIDLSAGTPFDIRSARVLTLFGRLKSGVSLGESQKEFDRLGKIQQEKHPDLYPPDESWSVSAVPLLGQVVKDVRGTLLLLFGSVGLVLLVVATNVANLQLTRGGTRALDLAVRVAIGGTRFRLVRQLVVESLVLGLIGCVGGVGLAFLGSALLRKFLAKEFPRIGNIEMDSTVLIFALGVSLFSVLVFGLLPALRLSRNRPGHVIGRRGVGSGPGRFLLTDLFVGVQAGLSLVFLVATGLLFQSLDTLARVDPGFDPSGVLTMKTWLPMPNDQSEGKYVDVQQRVALFDAALKGMERLPGVTHAAVTSLLPLRGRYGDHVVVEGGSRESDQGFTTTELRVISGSYFEAMGIPLMNGRTFAPTDSLGGPRVAMISKAFADRYFPGVDPLGRRLRLHSTGEAFFQIVGVVADVCDEALGVRGREAVYLSFLQGVDPDMTFVVKTTDRPESLARSSIWALQRTDPDLPAFSVVPMEELVAGARAQPRALLLLFTLFGLFTVVLAAMGTYGVVSSAVTRRTREIGIRLALGGEKVGILRMFFSEGFRLGLAGTVVGILSALGLSRFLRSVPFEVQSLDPWIYLGAAAFSLAVVALASFLPALSAIRVDPATSIRSD